MIGRLKMVCVTCGIKVLTWTATCGPSKVRESEIASNPLRLVALSRKPQLHQVNSSTSLCSQCSKESCCFQTRWCLGTEIVGSCQCLVVVFGCRVWSEKQHGKPHEEHFCSKDSQLFQLCLLPFWFLAIPNSLELQSVPLKLQQKSPSKSQQTKIPAPAIFDHLQRFFTKSRDRWWFRTLFFKCSPLGEDVNPIWLAQGD